MIHPTAGSVRVGGIGRGAKVGSGEAVAGPSRRRLITIPLLVVFGLQVQFACAEPPAPEWAARPYEYLIVEQDLRTVLEEFGRNVGLRVVLSSAVQGRVKGNMPRGSGRVFLDALSRGYGLDWYHDGFALHVSSSSESRSRQLELHDLSFEAALDGIKAAGLHDARFQLRPGPTSAVALVSGPPRFVEVVSEAVVTMARKRSAASSPDTVVHVYRGSVSVERVLFPSRVSR